MTRTIKAGAASCGFVLACILGAALALAATPALAATGAISGTVTSVSTHQPLAGIEVCAITTAAFTPELEQEIEEGLELGSEQAACVLTEATGAYTISGLGAGTFLVSFANPFGGTLNYVGQVYDDKEPSEEATEVTVAAGSTTSGIDAELHEGAEASGTITNAATGAPLEGASVCAAPSPGAAIGEFGCARSGAGGAYMVVGLDAGPYTVFALEPGFSVSFYGGAGSLTEAASVTLVLKQDHGGVNIALAPRPAGTAGTGEAGTGTPGGVPGSGGPLSGESGSNTRKPPGPVKGVALANALVREHNRRSVLVRLSCHARRGCRGEIRLSATRQIRRAHKRVAQTVAIGSARFSAESGHSFTVRVRLSSLGGSMLKAAHGHLGADLRIVQKSPRPSHTTVKRVLLVGRRAAKKS